MVTSNQDYGGYGDTGTQTSVPIIDTRSSTVTSTTSTGFQPSTSEATDQSDQISSSSTSSTSYASQTSVIDYEYEKLSHVNEIVTLNILGWDSVSKAPFGDLCPSGNCLEDCQDYGHVFQLQSENTNQGPDFTLFGICSNLGMIYGDLYQANDSVMQTMSSYFPHIDQSADAVDQVVAGLSSCLAGSCDASRNPIQCNTSCSLSVLDYGNKTMNMQAVALCLDELCKNTCGLPYADQDVYGVGVLISYIMQAIIVFVLAIWIVFLAMRSIWGTKKKNDDQSANSNFEKFIKSFLGAQCYFGISLQAAALYSKPKDVNPLTGYATMSVAVTGFLPTVFTLMLLGYYGAKSRYLSLLTALSWLLATVVFFELESNLSRFTSGISIQDSSLRQLYDISTCGGSSALAVCSETLGSSPLDYLSGYYNNGSGLVSLRNTKILWAWSTLCLILCLVSRFFSGNKKQTLPRIEKEGKVFSTKLQSIFIHWKILTLTLATSLFLLCFVYQALMVWKYQQMDVINWKGWTFGQIMAVATWIPSVLEYMENEFSDWWNKRHEASYTPGKEYSSILTLPQPQSLHQPPGLSVNSELDLEGNGDQDTGDDLHRPETQLLSQSTEYHNGL